MTHTLYIISDRSKTKIGFTSRSLEQRLKEYNTHNAHWELFESFRMDAESAKQIESTVKHFYKARRSSSGGDEWFDVPPNDVVTLIRSLIAANESGSASEYLILHKIRPNSEVLKAQSELHSLLNREPSCFQGTQENIQKKKETLQSQIRSAFAKAFRLGLHKSMLDQHPIAGISICPPDLKHAKTSSSLNTVREAIWRGQGCIEPPFLDHEDYFYHLAPLSTRAASYAFCSAITFQPYIGDSRQRLADMREKISSYAEDVGWMATEHPEWNWYFPGKTTLFLLIPKTTLRETIHQFDESFKKFVVERVKRYELMNIPRIQDVLERIVYDDCFPLDVKSFSQLNMQYIAKFLRMRLDMEDPEDRELIAAYEFLFAEWNESRQ